MHGWGDAPQPGDALVLLALGFPELAVDVAQLSLALPGSAGRAGSVRALLAAPGKCLQRLLKFAISLGFVRLEPARCMTAGEGVSRRIAGCPATSCCLRAGEAGGRAVQDAATAAAGEQGGQAGFEALEGLPGAARPWLPAGICCWPSETAPKCCTVLT